MPTGDRSLDDIITGLVEDLKATWSEPAVGPVIRSVDHFMYTNAVGKRALQLVIVLADPAGGDTYPFSKLKPIRDRIYEYLREHHVERMPYVRFMLASEEAQIQAGTYGV